MSAGTYSFTKTVCVVVGPEKVSFTLHPHITCTDGSCRYLKSAMKITWQSAEGSLNLEDVGPLTLEDVDPNTFQRYVQWIYGGATLRADKDENGFDFLFQEYALADRLNDLGTMNKIIDEIITRGFRIRLLPGLDAVKIAYGNTIPENSLLRKLVLDGYVHEAAPEALDSLNEEWPSEFLVPLKEALASMESPGHVDRSSGSFGALLEENPCRYHYHDSGYTKADHGCNSLPLPLL